MISVIVPVYNAAAYLEQCLDSLLAQSCSDFELLLVDDGSNDGSAALCDAYAARDARVKVFHKQNGGVSSARNLGLENAAGEWICFVDADDYVAGDMLERLLWLAGRQPNSLAACGNRSFDVSGNTTACTQARGVELFNRRAALLQQHRGDTPMRGNLCKLYPAWLFRENGLRFAEDIHLGEDMLMIFGCLLLLDGAVYDGEPRYFVRLHPGSATGTLFSPKQLTIFDTLSRMIAEAPDDELLGILMTDYTRQALELTATVYRHREYLTPAVQKTLRAALKKYLPAYLSDTSVASKEKLRCRLWAICPRLVAAFKNLRRR